MKVPEDVTDPDELQLMDQCNRDWIQAWKDATTCSHAANAVAMSHRTPRK